MGQKDFDLTPFTFTIALGACTPEVKIWFEFNHGQDSLQKTTVHPIEDRGLIQTHQHGFSVDFLNDHANQMSHLGLSDLVQHKSVKRYKMIEYNLQKVRQDLVENNSALTIIIYPVTPCLFLCRRFTTPLCDMSGNSPHSLKRIYRKGKNMGDRIMYTS